MAGFCLFWPIFRVVFQAVSMIRVWKRHTQAIPAFARASWRRVYRQTVQISCGKRFTWLVANGWTSLAANGCNILSHQAKHSWATLGFTAFLILLAAESTEFEHHWRNECSGKRFKMKWQTEFQKDTVWIGKRRANAAANEKNLEFRYIGKRCKHNEFTMN